MNHIRFPAALFALAYTAALCVDLGGCATDPQTIFAEVQTGYFGAVSGEYAYAKSGKADKAILAKIEAARLTAWAIIGPIQTSGVRPSSDQALAAEVAVNTFEALIPPASVTP